MQIEPSLKAEWEAYRAHQSVWRKRNHFYHAYRDKVATFQIPTGARTLWVEDPYNLPQEGSYEYIVVADLLGYVPDIQQFLSHIRQLLAPRGRLVITQYSTLWEPILRLASMLGLRAPTGEQSWVSPQDLKNLLHLAGFEVVRGGSKMLMPIYVPLISAFLNTVIANLWPFSKLGLIKYVVAKTANTKRQESSISIVIPARNEAGTIKRIIEELPELGTFTELIFIEGHSTDDTRAVIEREVAAYTGPKRLVVDVQDGRGKGDAVRKGFAKATGEILAIYDADMTVPPEDMRKFYEAIVTDRGDFINGSRLMYPVERGAMRLANIFGNKFFSGAFSWILGQPLKDTLCGTKVLWHKDYQAIAANQAFFGEFDPFGDFDLIFGAAKLNLKIVDMPIRYRDRVYGSTNISRWRHGVLLLRMTLFAARKLVFW